MDILRDQAIQISAINFEIDNFYGYILSGESISSSDSLFTFEQTPNQNTYISINNMHLDQLNLDIFSIG